MSEGSDDRPDRPVLGDKPDRPALGDRPAQEDRPDRPVLGDRPDRPVLGDRPAQGDRPVLGDRLDQGDRPDRPVLGDRRPEPSVKARLRARARKKARKGKKRMFQRRKVCRFCADKQLALNYKEVKTLRLFVSETGKIIPSRISGNCAKHQRTLAVAIKRSRHLAFLPYAAGHL